MRNKLLILFVSLGLLLVILAIRIKITNKHSIPTYTQATGAKLTGTENKFKIRYDLYYYRHPYLARAHQLNEERKYDSAISSYKEASLKFERDQQWESYVWVNSYLARLYLLVNGKNYADALPYLQKALQKGNKYLGNQHPCTAITMFYYGMYLYREQQADKALQMYSNALTILSGNNKEQNIYTADICEEIGNVQFNLKFDNAAAEKYYLKSVRIKETLPATVKDSILTESYYYLVKLYFLLRDFDKAQAYCYQAMHYAPYAKHFRLYWSEMLEGVLASTYNEQRSYYKVILRLKEAIRINAANKSDKGFLCFYYNSLGDVYSKDSRYDSAILCYKKSLQASRYSSLFENQRLQAASADYALGMTYTKLKNFQLALVHLRACLTTRLAVYGEKHRETAIAFQGIGTVYQGMGLPDSTVSFFQKAVAACTTRHIDSGLYAVPSVADINSSFYSFLIIKDKAYALKQLYNRNPSDVNLLRSSLAYYCVADTLITLFRTRYNQENTQLIFIKDNSSIYEDAIDCATLLYQATENSMYHNWAFKFMDKQKSALLLEALQEEQAFEQAGVTAQDQKMYYSLLQTLTFLEGRLEEENGAENPDEATLQALQTKINAVDGNMQTLKTKFYTKYTFYSSMHEQDDTISLKDLQRFSGYANSMIVEYFWGDKAVYMLGVYKSKTALLKIDKDEQTEKCVDSLQANLAKGYVFATRDADFVSFQTNSFYVYHLLVEPVLRQYNLQAEKTIPSIVVIPDGPVSFVPFEALSTTAASGSVVDYQKLHYLLRDFSISYSYSARLLLKNYQRLNTSQGSKVLALSYSKEDSSQESHFGTLNAFRKNTDAELPGSAKEIKAISAYMNGEFYTGESATEEVFKKKAPFYDILHVAVHGQADSKSSYRSRLIFKTGLDSSDDGSLYPYEIYSIPLKAKLVVLSACESGIGKFNPGEGMYSMARGFAYGGCPSIVMSLWRANDYSTASIMATFYQHLSEGAEVNQALKNAKLVYLDKADRRSAHPANWAAFAAMGNMTAITRKSNAITAKIVLIAAAVCACLMIYLLIAKSNKLKDE